MHESLDRFNSILVRLKVGTVLYLYGIRDRRFNSILVRLKGAGAYFTQAIAEFQFHTGSIKSSPEVAKAYKDFLVSIPYWFD